MNLTLTIREKTRHLHPWMLIIVAVYTCILFTALRTFVLWQSINFLIGVAALLTTTSIQRENKSSLRYACASMVLACLVLAIPVKTVLFFALSFGVFFLIESFYGRMNILPLFILCMISPVFQFFANIFSFEIRLWLTDWAGSLLNFAGVACTVEGNLIHRQGGAFSVDPACMGLNMTITALLCGIIIIATFQKRYQRKINMVLTTVILALIVLLNVISNLVRIVWLVQFEILPDTWMHDMVGILCLVVYVIVPSVFFIRWVTEKWGNPVVTKENVEPAPVSLTHWFLNIVNAAALVIAAYAVIAGDEKTRDTSKQVPQIKPYTVSRITADITKLESNTSLVYIKQIAGFYSADHNPMICWRGSGYTFEQLKQEKWGTIALYTATLKSQKDSLYTSWWYESRERRTISQVAWRWDALRNGNSYSVVNVTASSEQMLKAEIEKIHSRNLFGPLLAAGSKAQTDNGFQHERFSISRSEKRCRKKIPALIFSTLRVIRPNWRPFVSRSPRPSQSATPGFP